MTERHIEYLDPRSLTPWKNNARTHSRKQLGQLEASILRFGFTNPVLVDNNNRILAGHGRVEAAKSIGMDTVPCICIEHLSEAEKRAYVLADNKLAQNAGWDEDLLRLELGALSELDLDFGCCQTKAKWSLFFNEYNGLDGQKLAPFEEGGVSVQLEATS
ncbi:ParB/Srx family N-terminal domain-containing protein [Henriciella marina]|uniref:ParB/Srx family N-terminal domain-containing protein n=1 Tax=Henriciella marina TaxID=453851 RepID=A0ABT4LQN8_9PROT|nr:ParB/Srx family N-terminal domain-containing protein [Henriciella marina]MCZ4296432.1 ParB/Srx family N-terminal domain-containing protein [Henriciella marina]